MLESIANFIHCYPKDARVDPVYQPVTPPPGVFFFLFPSTNASSLLSPFIIDSQLSKTCHNFSTCLDARVVNYQLSINSSWSHGLPQISSSGIARERCCQSLPFNTHSLLIDYAQRNYCAATCNPKPLSMRVISLQYLLR